LEQNINGINAKLQYSKNLASQKTQRLLAKKSSLKLRKQIL